MTIGQRYGEDDDLCSSHSVLDFIVMAITHMYQRPNR